MQWWQDRNAVQLPLNPLIKRLPRLSPATVTKVPCKVISPSNVLNFTPYYEYPIIVASIIVFISYFIYLLQL